jgi:hypothetical protein
LSKWRSVFGIANTAAKVPDGCVVANDTDENHTGNGVSGNDFLGHKEWLALFAGNTLKSKYQDGHFAYAVIPGSGSGVEAEPPVLYLIDIENASQFNNVLEP